MTYSICKLDLGSNDKKIVYYVSCRGRPLLTGKCFGLSTSEVRAVVIQKRNLTISAKSVGKLSGLYHWYMRLALEQLELIIQWYITFRNTTLALPVSHRTWQNNSLRHFTLLDVQQELSSIEISSCWLNEEYCKARPVKFICNADTVKVTMRSGRKF